MPVTSLPHVPISKSFLISWGGGSEGWAEREQRLAHQEMLLQEESRISSEPYMVFPIIRNEKAGFQAWWDRGAKTKPLRGCLSLNKS